MSAARVPLHAWSARRRFAVAICVAAATCALMLNALLLGDLSGVGSARTALTDMRQRVDDARRKVAQLPELRRTVGPPPSPVGPDDVLRDVSQWAAAAGITLISLEPGSEGAAVSPAMQTLKLDAHGDFAQLTRFLRGLCRLPALTVPTALVIKRGARAALLVTATLGVHAELHMPCDAEEDADPSLADPFASRPGGVPGGPAFKLVGVLLDPARRRSSLALVETPDGTVAVASGGTLAGDARVVRIEPSAVVLRDGETTRAITWEKDER